MSPDYFYIIPFQGETLTFSVICQGLTNFSSYSYNWVENGRASGTEGRGGGLHVGYW
jgi:hypothetical protein